MKKEPSRIMQGLMRLDNVSVDQLYELIKFDIDNGVNFFDLADIYGGGNCEAKFGEVIKNHPELKNQIYVQSKCGINVCDDTYYDCSKEHIINSCLKALKRCNLEYFDSYLLHRPDILMDANEIKEAFEYLFNNGYVKCFGVSNFSKEMIQYLLDSGLPIKINQLQLGLGHLNMIKEALNFNVDNNEGKSHTTDIYFYLKRKKIALQCWSPFQYGFFEGSIFKHENMKKCNEKLSQLAQKYQVSKACIATAFLLALGDNVYVISGAVEPNRIKDSIDALNITLTKKEWYSLYKSTGCMLP